MDNLIRSKMLLIMVTKIQSQQFLNIPFKRIEMYEIDGKDVRVSFLASVARRLPRVFSLKSPSGHACHSTKRSLAGYFSNASK